MKSIKETIFIWERSSNVIAGGTEVHVQQCPVVLECLKYLSADKKERYKARHSCTKIPNSRYTQRTSTPSSITNCPKGHFGKTVKMISGRPLIAAIWDMASNGTNTGIPESYCNPCHWLSTWKKMYRFNINPVNGPQAWKKSDVPTTIIPPKPHLQIGRPPKKRKKSAAQLADEIMKSNKMTRPHRQHRLQLEEDTRVKKVDMLVLVDKGMDMSFIDLKRPGMI
ncbi:hypothetical protein Tco_0144024 [Tanacetum coccineum]